MKKLLTFALCMAAIGGISAQESDVKAIYTEGEAKFNAYDDQYKTSMVNPSAVDPVQMGQELIDGYNLFVKAFPLDQLPDAKGKVKPKYTKKMIDKIKGHANDYFKAGADMFNAQKYYPEAYEGFMIYADMPNQDFMADQKLELPNEDRGTAYFNAGLAAYQGNEIYKSADAFRMARGVGYDDKQAFIYEIACWQTAAQRDSTMVETAKQKIIEVAEEGDAKYGIAEPIFVNNIVNFLVSDNKYDEALAKVDALIAANPDNAGLYGLRGFVYDRQGNDEASVNDYRKSAALEGADYETLKNAGKKIYRVGADKWNSIEGNSSEAQAARQDVKVNYFEASKAIAEKAKAMNQDNSDSDLDYLIENIDYALTTFFN